MGVTLCVLHVLVLYPTQYDSSYVMLAVTETELDCDALVRLHESYHVCMADMMTHATPYPIDVHVPV